MRVRAAPDGLHEGHGLLEPASTSRARSSGAEAPPDNYAATNASEDLAQSVAYFFTDRKRLQKGLPDRATGEVGNPCPKRDAFIKRASSAAGH